MPKSTSGLDIINLKMWNKAAIAKTCWNLARKKYSLRIRWIHSYYVKQQQVESMQIPQQACWMVKKIIKARDMIQNIQNNRQENRSIINQVYWKQRRDHPRVSWKILMYQNQARPKAVFIMWLQLQGKLLTLDRLNKWGRTGEKSCANCKVAVETRDHLFVECEFAKKIWKKLAGWIQVKWVDKLN